MMYVPGYNCTQNFKNSRLDLEEYNTTDSTNIVLYPVALM